jgi:hypothetical protein
LKHEIEFSHDGGVIIVEVDEIIPRGDRLVAREGVAERATQSFEEAVGGIRPIAETIMRQVAALAPESVSVEFGIKFSAQAGVILASSAVEGNCKVTLNWKPKLDR